MKIGILTFHRALNYGAVLQCYGLYQTLSRLGHDVEVIDYRPEYVERHRQILQSYNLRNINGFINRLKGVAASALNIGAILDANKRFDAFLHESFSMSEMVDDVKHVPQYYDMIFFGSDQIWSPKICNGLDPIYWGQFPHDKAVLASYAASLGSPQEITDEDWNTVSDYIKAFRCVSVREMQFKEILNSRLGMEAKCVLDPSLLLNSEDYDSLVEEPQIKGDYVLAFSIVEAQNFMRFTKKVASELNCQVVVLSAIGEPMLLGKNKNNIVTPTVGGFLGLFKHAKCVVTTSFHGTVFSIIFNRPFYSAIHRKSMRVQSLLSQLELNDRLAEFSDNFIKSFKFEEIDYDTPLSKLNLLKENSIQFIKDTLCKKNK